MLQKIRLTIRLKIILFFFFTALIPFLTASWIILARINDSLIRKTQVYDATLLTSVSGDIDFIIRSHVKTVRHMLNLSTFKKGLNDIPYRSIEDEISISSRILGIPSMIGGESTSAVIGLRQIADENISGSFAIFQLEKKSIIDQLPYKVFKPSPYAVIPELGKLTAEPLFRDLENTDKPFVFGSSRLSAGNEAAGRPTLLYKYRSPDYQGPASFNHLIFIGFHKDTLNKIYQEIPDLRSGTLIIMDQKNRLLSISHPASDDYFTYDDNTGQYTAEIPGDRDPETGLTLKDYNRLLIDRSVIRDPAFQKILNTQENTTKTHRFYYKNIEYFLNSHTSSYSGVRLFFFKPSDFIKKPADYFILFGLMLTLLLCSAVIFIGVKLSRTFTSPILSLKEQTQKLSDGNYDIRLVSETKDELSLLAESFNTMVTDIRTYQNRLVNSEADKLELELAKKIQTSLLPPDCQSPFYEISTLMKTADMIGGDFFDQITDPKTGRIWLAIGDVSGSGLVSGLISMMAQTCFNTLILQKPDIAAEDLISAVNRVLYKNIRIHLMEDDFMTALFLLLDTSGSVFYTGGHLPLIVWRSKTGQVEKIPSYGMWLGIMDDIRDKEFISRLHLDPEDVLFLFTDGLIEAMDTDNRQYDLERLMLKLQQCAHKPVEEIRDEIYEDVCGYMKEQNDDISIMVIRKKKNLKS